MFYVPHNLIQSLKQFSSEFKYFLRLIYHIVTGADASYDFHNCLPVNIEAGIILKVEEASNICHEIRSEAECAVVNHGHRRQVISVQNIVQQVDIFLKNTISLQKQS